MEEEENSGFSATCVHPATMGITDNFICNWNSIKNRKAN
jgi:hypothetical protein